MRKKVLSLLLTLAMLCGLCVPSAFATGKYSDTEGHWAEESIDRWSAYGIINGYNGAFSPDDSITRGQLATILSNTLGLTETAENPFTDVPADAWYTPYVLRCYAAGIMQGDGVNAHPEAAITRQEAMTMLCRAFAVAPAKDADLSAFVDNGETADWAVPFVAALVDSGIVDGIGNDMLAPIGDMSRAAVVTVIDRAIVQYITAPGDYELTDKDGLILVAAGDVTLTGKTGANILVTPAADGKSLTFNKATVTGSITVQADNAEITTKNSKLPDITMIGEGSKVEEDKPTYSGGWDSYIPSAPSVPSGPSSMTITEGKTVSSGTYQNVTITDAVGDGEVTLSGLTIQGDLTIQGGGSNSIKLENCTVAGKVIMAKISGEAPRLYLTNTPITKVEAKQPAIIEAADAASIVTAVEAAAAVEIKGENTAIATITVPAEVESTVAITVTAGAVETIAVKSDATITGAAASVAEVVAEAPVSVASDAVEKVEVPATAPADVAVTVTGTSAIEVAVNSENGVAISSGSATVEVSTELESTPNVTVDDTPVTHIHKWNSGEITTAATCEGTGVKTYSCTAEGCTDPIATKTETIPALGHNYGSWALSDNDNHSRVCANDANHVETAAHTWDDGVETTAPTCENDGVKTFTCSICTGTKTKQIPTEGHKYGEWTKVDATNHQRICENDASHIETEAHTVIEDAAVSATCTASGLTAGSHCGICNGVIAKQTIIEALNHDFSGAYTYDTTGHWHICARDNCEETDTKASHTYSTTNCAEEATCVCGYTKAAGEHTWDDGTQTTAPTCEGEGVKTYTCQSCSATKTEAIPAAGHAWGDWTKADDTNHTRTCGNDSSHTETAAHSWDNGVVTTEPTETTEGVKTYTCSDCPATKTEEIPAIGTDPIFGTPVLKTDGTFLWLELTVQNVEDPSTLQLWVQNVIASNGTISNSYMSHNSLSTQWSLEGNTLKIYRAGYVMVSNSNLLVHMAVKDPATGVMSEYSTNALVAGTTTTENVDITAVKASPASEGDYYTITCTRNDGSSFGAGHYYVHRPSTLDYNSIIYMTDAAATLVVKNKDCEILAAAKATAKKVAPTTNDAGNVVVNLVAYNTYTFNDVAQADVSSTEGSGVVSAARGVPVSLTMTIPDGVTLKTTTPTITSRMYNTVISDVAVNGNVITFNATFNNLYSTQDTVFYLADTDTDLGYPLCTKTLTVTYVEMVGLNAQANVDHLYISFYEAVTFYTKDGTAVTATDAATVAQQVADKLVLYKNGVDMGLTFTAGNASGNTYYFFYNGTDAVNENAVYTFGLKDGMYFRSTSNPNKGYIGNPSVQYNGPMLNGATMNMTSNVLRFEIDAYDRTGDAVPALDLTKASFAFSPTGYWNREQYQTGLTGNYTSVDGTTPTEKGTYTIQKRVATNYNYSGYIYDRVFWTVNVMLTDADLAALQAKLDTYNGTDAICFVKHHGFTTCSSSVNHAWNMGVIKTLTVESSLSGRLQFKVANPYGSTYSGSIYNSGTTIGDASVFATTVELIYNDTTITVDYPADGILTVTEDMFTAQS